MFCLNKLKDKKNKPVAVSYDEIIVAAQLKKDVRKSAVKEFAANFAGALSTKIVRYEEESSSGSFKEVFIPFFYKITNDPEGEEIVLTLHPEVYYLANELKSNYAAIKLDTYYGRKTPYSNRLLVHLATARYLGHITFTKGQLSQVLAIPKTYDSSRAKSRVIEPAIEDLSEEFPGLECEYIKVGRKIGKYKFTWDKQAQYDRKRKEVSSKKEQTNHEERKDVTSSTSIYEGMQPTELTEEELAEFFKNRY